MKFIAGLIIGLLLIWGINLFYKKYYLPNIIERRARDLNLMRYNGEKDRFIGKDSIIINQWDLYYLQYGTTDGY